jgi:hypothetical protein
MSLSILAQLRPIEAIREGWRHTDPAVPVATVGGGLGGWFDGVPWAALGSIVGFLLVAFGAPAIQLYKQVRIANIEIEAAKRRAAGPPMSLRALVPDRRPNG